MMFGERDGWGEMRLEQILNYPNPTTEDHIFLAWQYRKLDLSDSSTGSSSGSSGSDDKKEVYEQRISNILGNQEKTA